jgi:MoxR-like ATPase
MTAKTQRTIKLIRQLQTELNELFPERESLITQLVYALLTREHVLVFGKFGTGKSRLVEDSSAFTGANLYSVELTKFMTESSIVGIEPEDTARRRQDLARTPRHHA